MDFTDGRRRGNFGFDTGALIRISVGDQTLVQIFNVIENIINCYPKLERKQLKAREKFLPIHQPTPPFA